MISTGVFGFGHRSKITDKDTEKIGAKHKTGTTHKVRVMGYRRADNLVQVSDERKKELNHKNELYI